MEELKKRRRKKSDKLRFPSYAARPWSVKREAVLKCLITRGGCRYAITYGQSYVQRFRGYSFEDDLSSLLSISYMYTPPLTARDMTTFSEIKKH